MGCPRLTYTTEFDREYQSTRYSHLSVLRGSTEQKEQSKKTIPQSLFSNIAKVRLLVESPGIVCSQYCDYRYGFNGMEKDDEVKGQGNHMTTPFRQYDPRIGRWMSLDPLAAKYPNMSPYVAFNNNPIIFADPSGLEGEPKMLEEFTVDGTKSERPQAKSGNIEIDDSFYRNINATELMEHGAKLADIRQRVNRVDAAIDEMKNDLDDAVSHYSDALTSYKAHKFVSKDPISKGVLYFQDAVLKSLKINLGVQADHLNQLITERNVLQESHDQSVNIIEQGLKGEVRLYAFVKEDPDSFPDVIYFNTNLYNDKETGKGDFRFLFDDNVIIDFDNPTLEGYRYDFNFRTIGNVELYSFSPGFFAPGMPSIKTK